MSAWIAGGYVYVVAVILVIGWCLWKIEHQPPRGNVLRYGADPTGEKDSTEALKRAVEDVERAGGGVVVVPPGTYRLEGKWKP